MGHVKNNENARVSHIPRVDGVKKCDKMVMMPRSFFQCRSQWPIIVAHIELGANGIRTEWVALK